MESFPKLSRELSNQSQIIFNHSKSFDMRGNRKYMTSVQDGIKQQLKPPTTTKIHTCNWIRSTLRRGVEYRYITFQNNSFEGWGAKT